MKEQQSPHFELLFLGVLSYFLFNISQFVFFGVCSLFTSLEFLQAHIQDSRIVLGSALIMQVFTFCVPALVIIRTSGRRYTDFIGIGKWERKWFGITIVAFIVAYLFMLILGSINARLEDILPGNEMIAAEKEQNEFMTALMTSGNYVQLFFSVAIIGLVTAICEELFFRGFVLGCFMRISQGNKHFAVITSALIFAGLHLQPLKLLPMLFLGICLGYLYTESKNLKYSILFHFLINSSQIVMIYFLSGEI